MSRQTVLRDIVNRRNPVVRAKCLVMSRPLQLFATRNDWLSCLAPAKTERPLAFTLSGIFDESLPVLIQLTEFKYLTLIDSELSPDSVETIRATLPGVTISEHMSLETAEGLGITAEVIASQRRFVVIAHLVIVLSAGCLVLLVVLIWRQRQAKRLRRATWVDSGQ